jgi:hypothetical protein
MPVGNDRWHGKGFKISSTLPVLLFRFVVMININASISQKIERENVKK